MSCGAAAVAVVGDGDVGGGGVVVLWCMYVGCVDGTMAQCGDGWKERMDRGGG